MTHDTYSCHLCIHRRVCGSRERVARSVLEEFEESPYVGRWRCRPDPYGAADPYDVADRLAESCEEYNVGVDSPGVGVYR